MQRGGVSSGRVSKGVNALGSVPQEISETKLCCHIERLSHNMRIQELHHSPRRLLVPRVSPSAHQKYVSQHLRGSAEACPLFRQPPLNSLLRLKPLGPTISG